MSRYYVLEDGLLYRITDPSKCGSYAGLQPVAAEGILRWGGGGKATYQETVL